MKYYDFSVNYVEESYEEFLKVLVDLGYAGVGIVFPKDSLGKIEEAGREALDHGLEFFSRYNIAAESLEEFDKEASRYRGKVDILALERLPPKMAERINLKKVSIIGVENVTGPLIRKIRGRAKPPSLEFNMKKASMLLKEKPHEFGRMLRMAFLSDLQKVPLIVSSGAEDVLDLKPPLQLLYAFQGLIRSEEISKRYISTLPRPLIPETFGGVG
ncbi:MAG: hypothetical protein ACE5GD_10630 [Candidatus Geothermarchaeales archaeon]